MAVARSLVSSLEWMRMTKTMTIALTTTLAMVLAMVLAVEGGKSPPLPPPQYTVSFVLTMPETMPGTHEAFTVFYDETTHNEFVSLDGGMETQAFLTHADGSHHFYQISPRGGTPGETHMECRHSGFQGKPFMYSAFPYNLGEFEYVGTQSVGGKVADVFFLSAPPPAFPHATNNMTYYVDASSGIPLKYEYVGFYSAHASVGVLNDLNYDTFTISYTEFVPKVSNTSVFDPPKDCLLVAPGSGEMVSTPHMLASRMHGMAVPDHAAGLDATFEAFKVAHGKGYSGDSAEHKERRAAFENNLAAIHRLNNAHGKAMFGLNRHGDSHPEELKALRMGHPIRHSGKVAPGAIVYSPKTEGVGDLPDSFDWRDKGAVGPPKEQGACGGCFAFGSVAALETAVFLKHGPGPDGQPLALSEQMALDCTETALGCDGGSAPAVFDTVKRLGGLASLADYPFLDHNGACHKAPIVSNASVSHHETILPFDRHHVMDALVNSGVLAVSVSATPEAWTWYSSGILDLPSCSNLLLDHVVGLVGYGTDPEPYFILRNTWSLAWGESSYMRIAMAHDCGVTTDAVLPVLA